MTVTREDLSAVMAPVDSARGLPNACYTDSADHAAEARSVFFSGWAGLAFAEDAPEPGSVAPVRFLGQPLLIARDLEGVLRVFLNVCRHRGMILVEEATTLSRAIRCPYHSWCYELDGRLRTTPHVGGPGVSRHDCVNRAQLGLVEVPSAIWMGVVWINLDGRGGSFEDWAAPLRTRWSDLDRAVFGSADGRFALDVACNWKLAVENYCESYHLPWVHPGLNSYSRLEDHYNIEEPGCFSGQGTRAYRPMLAEDGRRFPVVPGLPAMWAEGAEYVALYPNVLLGVHKDHAFAIILDPQGPERTVERVAIFYFDRAVVADAEWQGMRARNTRMWKEVFEEDVFVVEGMQKGRHAAGFDGGRFSPVMDGPTHCFHAWIANRLAHAAPMGHAAAG